MAVYLIQDSTLEDIADAIRAKTGGTSPLSPADMADAIEDELVKPSGTITITQQSGTDVSDKATASVRSGSLALNTPSVNSSTGVVTASASLSTSGWIGSAPSSKTLQLTTQASKTVTPGTSQQTAVASGRYTTGAVYVAGDADLVASNIKSGVSIFGVTGTYEGSGGTLIEKTITQNGVYNASDDSADGYSKVTVAVSGGGGATIVEEENEFGGITMTITE